LKLDSEMILSLTAKKSSECRSVSVSVSVSVSRRRSLNDLFGMLIKRLYQATQHFAYLIAIAFQLGISNIVDIAKIAGQKQMIF
jgi:hypothetical protein